MIKSIKKVIAQIRNRSKVNGYVKELKKGDRSNKPKYAHWTFCSFQDGKDKEVDAGVIMHLLEKASQEKTELNPKEDKAAQSHPHNIHKINEEKIPNII